MRRKLAIGVMGCMVLLGAAMITQAQEGPAAGPGGEHHEWGGGPHEFMRGGGPDEHFGRDRGEHRGFGGGEHLLRMAENPRVRAYLGLTDDQVNRLHKIGIDSEKASVQTRADMELRHIELRELLRADNPDHDAIMHKLDEVNALRGKMEKQHVETFLSARSVLNADQIGKVKALMEHGGPGFGHEHGMERHGMGHPPGPGSPHEGAPEAPEAPPAPPAQ